MIHQQILNAFVTVLVGSTDVQTTEYQVQVRSNIKYSYRVGYLINDVKRINPV